MIKIFFPHNPKYIVKLKELAGYKWHTGSINYPAVLSEEKAALNALHDYWKFYRL
jgi:hypothetical protein